MPGPGELRFRPATPDDLVACSELWRVALNDYLGRLNLPLIPDELAGIQRLHAHTQATDADRFWVATRPIPGHPPESAPIVGFVSAVVRGRLWFLSMLFVHPGEQGRGLGRALLARVIPESGADLTLATATDSVQPISNALYSTYGIVPRTPLLALVGNPTALDALGGLPSGVSAVPFESIAAGAAGGQGHRELVEAVDGLDAEVAGFTHPQDHRYLRVEGRRGYLYRSERGDVLGYGYTSEAGRVGPVAVIDEALLAPVLGHLLVAVEPRGAFAVWTSGLADHAVVPLLRAGLRFDGLPLLFCWSRPFGDPRRYLPISPGLL